MASGTGQRFFLYCLVTLALIGAVSSTANFTILGNIPNAANEALNNLFSNSSTGRVRRAPDILEYFPSYDQIINWMEDLDRKYGGAVVVENVATTAEGRQIKAIIINFTNSWKTVFIVATLHARDWGSTAAALHVINELTNNAVSYPKLQFRFIIIPVANPDGYVYSWERDRFWRKNRARQWQGTVGVDLNRNFGYKWHKVYHIAETEPAEETYRGPTAFSEVESKIIKKAMLWLRQWLVLFVDLHSPGQTILYPWGFTKRPAREENQLRAVAAAAAEAIKNEAGTTYQYGSLSELQGSVGGTALDYCHAIDVNACFGLEVGTEVHMETVEIPQLGTEAMAAIASMALNAVKYKDS
uniref:Peptidase M14 domain-containing protein n=1 Tax=Anopheles atroparvus TaxID=41427 RepID=A0AAG5DGV0_ANOAO